MINRGILKYTFVRFYRDYPILGIYLCSMILFLVIAGFDPVFLSLESSGEYIYGRTFFFNVILSLALSAGILGREIRDGFMVMIVSKPVKRENIYLTKFFATLLYGSALLIIYLLILAFIIIFIHKVNLSFWIVLKAFILLFFDQIAIISFSTFLSSFLPGDLNVLVIILITIAIASLHQAFDSSPFQKIYRNIYLFLNPIKSMEIREGFLSRNFIPIKFFLQFIAYLFVLFASGIFIFKRLEIKR